jgi:hypothetical protein
MRHHYKILNSITQARCTIRLRRSWSRTDVMRKTVRDASYGSARVFQPAESPDSSSSQSLLQSLLGVKVLSSEEALKSSPAAAETKRARCCCCLHASGNDSLALMPKPQSGYIEWRIEGKCTAPVKSLECVSSRGRAGCGKRQNSVLRLRLLALAVSN